MRSKPNLYELLSGKLKIPEDVRPKAPLLELMGDNRILIENYLGIRQYDRDEIIVRLRYGDLHIHGNGLELACMNHDSIVICGRISTIEICRGQRNA